MRLNKAFYAKNAKELAPLLIGKLFCRKLNNTVIKLRITETECYYGTQDTACHAHKGKTPRNAVMFDEGGVLYIYLCYGIHHLINVVCGEEGFPQAVLIRGLEGYNGPGKLSKNLQITTKEYNGYNLCEGDEIWIEDDGSPPQYTCHKRIGIDYATQEYKDKLWRFVINTDAVD